MTAIQFALFVGPVVFAASLALAFVTDRMNRYGESLPLGLLTDLFAFPAPIGAGWTIVGLIMLGLP